MLEHYKYRFLFKYSVCMCNGLYNILLESRSIGYPLVYMGFDATCYFSGILKLRTQKAVQSENDLHMHLLQHPLPPYTQLYPKLGVEGKSDLFFIYLLTVKQILYCI